MNIPSGVSVWKEYGKKYGYWNYFTSTVLSDYKSRLLSEVENIKGRRDILNGEELRYIAVRDILALIRKENDI